MRATSDASSSVTLLCKLCTPGAGCGATVRHRGIESLSELFGGKLRSRLAALLLASSSPAAAEAAAALKRLVTGLCLEPGTTAGPAAPPAPADSALTPAPRRTEFRVRALLLELVYKCVYPSAGTAVGAPLHHSRDPPPRRLVYTLNKGPPAAKAASIAWRRALAEAFRGADANAMLESSPKTFAAVAADLAARVAPEEETMVDGIDKVALPERAVELLVRCALAQSACRRGGSKGTDSQCPRNATQPRRGLRV